MKKTYIQPAAELNGFLSSDIITLSPVTLGDGDYDFFDFNLR